MTKHFCVTKSLIVAHLTTTSQRFFVKLAWKSLALEPEEQYGQKNVGERKKQKTNRDCD